MKFQAFSLAAVVLLFLAPQVNAACTTYTVVSGDTCWAIWTKFSLTEEEFTALNPTVNCSAVQIGSKVCVKASTTTTSGCKSYYEAISGDYCELMASKNKETLPQLMTDNPGLNCANVAIGDVMCIGFGKGSLPRIPIPDQKCTIKGTFAITFDDGPYKYTEGLLNFLKANNLKSTFFINGQNYGNIYNFNSTLKRIYNEGHQIAHHTWSHPDISLLSESKLRAEISKLEVAFRAIIGVIPTFFRPPYGNTNLLSLKVLQELGYRVIKWDVSNDDAINVEKHSKTLKQDQAAFNSSLAVAGIHPTKDGHISLSHDPQQATAQQFAPWVFPYVKKLGYKTQTVGECLGVPNRADWYRK